MIFWVSMATIAYGGARMLWHFVGVVMVDLKRLDHLDRSCSLPRTDPERYMQYALYKSMKKPTKSDCLAWATERELTRELWRRRVRRRLFYVFRRSCDTVLAVIHRLGGR